MNYKICAKKTYGGLFLSTLKMGSGDPLSGEVKGGGQGGGQKGGVGPPPKMGVEIRGFFGGQKMVKNGQKRCGTEG